MKGRAMSKPVILDGRDKTTTWEGVVDLYNATYPKVVSWDGKIFVRVGTSDSNRYREVTAISNLKEVYSVKEAPALVAPQPGR